MRPLSTLEKLDNKNRKSFLFFQKDPAPGLPGPSLGRISFSNDRLKKNIPLPNAPQLKQTLKN